MSKQLDAILALLTTMDSRMTALETPAKVGRKSSKGRKPASKGRKPVDHRTANERLCAKLVRRIAWHTARLSALGSKASKGQTKWNEDEIGRLTSEVERMRQHAVDHGETLPEDVKATRASKAMSHKGSKVRPDAAGIMGAHKGDTVDIAGGQFTCSGGGWFKDTDGDSIRRGDLIDLAS